MPKFTLRAECMLDAINFIHPIQAKLNKFSLENDEIFPDVFINIDVDMSYDELMDVLVNIRDANQMRSTLKLDEEEEE
jgi:biopolymer transport protein ExbD